MLSEQLFILTVLIFFTQQPVVEGVIMSVSVMVVLLLALVVWILPLKIFFVVVLPWFFVV